MEPYYDPQESHVNQIASGAMWQDLLVRFQQAERLTQSSIRDSAPRLSFRACGLEGRMGTTCWMHVWRLDVPGSLESISSRHFTNGKRPGISGMKSVPGRNGRAAPA